MPLTSTDSSAASRSAGFRVPPAVRVPLQGPPAGGAAPQTPGGVPTRGGAQTPGGAPEAAVSAAPVGREAAPVQAPSRTVSDYTPPPSGAPAAPREGASAGASLAAGGMGGGRERDLSTPSATGPFWSGARLVRSHQQAAEHRRRQEPMPTRREPPRVRRRCPCRTSPSVDRRSSRRASTRWATSWSHPLQPRHVPAPSHPGSMGASAAPSGASGSPAGGLDTDDIRRAWPTVLGRVFTMRRLTWTFVSQNAQVMAFDGRTLTLGIATAGLTTTFRSGNHSEVVRQALIDELGVDAVVDGVHVEEIVQQPAVAPPAGAVPSENASPPLDGPDRGWASSLLRMGARAKGHDFDAGGGRASGGDSGGPGGGEPGGVGGSWGDAGTGHDPRGASRDNPGSSSPRSFDGGRRLSPHAVPLAPEQRRLGKSCRSRRPTGPPRL